jgi:hypothetical protein
MLAMAFAIALLGVVAAAAWWIMVRAAEAAT